MPYIPTEELFAQYRDRALSSPEIRDKLEPLEWSDDEIKGFLADRKADIWSEAAKQISDYNGAEKAVATIDADRLLLNRQKPLIVRIYRDFLPIVLGLVVVIFGLAGVVALFSKVARHWIVLHRTVGWELLLFAAAFAILFLVVRWTGGSFFVRYDTYRREMAEKLESSEAEKARLLELIEPAMVTNITASLREFVEQKTKPFFSLELPETDTSRLSEVPNPQFDVITDSRRHVRGLVEKMNGGSIGVAGPRGCGKTTLLRSFCPEGNVNPRELTIFATAPVQYDPREFLLQLFTSVCSRVVAKETKTDVASTFTAMDSLRETTKPTFLRTEVIASILMTGSIILIFTGMLLGFVRLMQARHVPTSVTANTATSANSQGPQAKEEQGVIWVLLGSDALPYLLWGSVAWFVMAFMRAPGRSVYGRVLGIYPFGGTRGNRSEAEREEVSLAGVEQEARNLVLRAKQTLRGLRFQQSYSSGWSGALKLPVGLEGGVNAAMTFAERQLGLPEIVYEYRDFAKAAANYYDRVFIAIDEMDKLPSDEDAKKFLNGIKAIFGQEKIYYLVSISENALSNFERRGLPIRDEFDSSFDDAVHLGYFDLRASRRLLARRSTVPPPAPYRAYCHVCSGGLPRDLIRSCRRMYDYRRSVAGPIDLATMCTALTGLDIEAKLGAMRYNLHQIADERGTVSVLTLMATQVWTPAALEDVIYRLHHIQGELQDSENGEDADGAANLSALVNIAEELKAYLYFSLATVMTFKSIVNEQRYDQLESTGVFDRLASARQMLAVNRVAAIEALHALVPLPVSNA
jgi:hypothetical protein